MTITKSLPAIVAGILVLFNTTLFAKTYHSLEDIRNTAKQYVLSEYKSEINQTEIEIQVRPLDPRLKLKHCDKPLEAVFSQANFRGEYASIMVTCNSQNHWSLYVPVKISRFQDVLVYTRSLQRGHILTETDISLAKMNISRLNSGYVQDIEQIIGKVMQQNKMPGNIVLNSHYKTPLMVKRGEEIVLLSKSDTIEVRMKGKALAQGSLGEKIRVKNLRSNRIVNGTIIAPGIINVDS